MKRVLLLAALAVAMGTAAGWLWMPAKQTEAFIEVGKDAYVLAEPEPIAPFRLVAHDGQAFDNAALKGRWSFLFFGFTHCPDICPTTLAVFNEVHRALRSGAVDVRFVMVTVDPERDAPQVLAKYVPAFNPEFIGVTGEAGEIARLCDSLGVKYGKVPGSTPASYHMDHSSSVLVADPQGRFHGVFAPPHDAQNMVRGFLEMRRR